MRSSVREETHGAVRQLHRTRRAGVTTREAGVRSGLPLAAILNAIVTPDESDIMLAALLTVLLLPAGIAPKAHRAALARLDKHPVLRAVVFFSILLVWLFAFLSTILSHKTSAYIAVPAAAVLFTAAAITRHRSSE
ncbi:hypothetical protein [Kribbella sp. NPDC004536]|uniref:hypothetical protein n=1 Tax=Kribbella sp. NPDC004536 TaxID=3364106 RepID=UPI0036935467